MRPQYLENYQKDWNFNQGWHEEILLLLREAHSYRQRAASNASLESWWDAMRSIWAMVSYDLEKAIADSKEEKKKKLQDKQKEVEDAFKTANNYFMASSAGVAGASSQSVKILDTIEFGITYLIGALEYYKFKTEKKDPRFAT